MFVGFPNEFCIYSAELSRTNGLVRFQKRYETYYVKEGLAYLQNGLAYPRKEGLKDHLVRSITDMSIKLNYEPRETSNTYVIEYSLVCLKKALILVVRINSGDIYIYKGILKTTID